MSKSAARVTWRQQTAPDVCHFATTRAFTELAPAPKLASASLAGVALPATSPAQMVSGVKLATGTAHARMAPGVIQ